jgi:transcriptional regulator with XRE-family HTH domain
MIKNAREYQITKAQVARFERALVGLEPGVDPALAELEADAIRGQLSDLRAELEEYDELTSGRRTIVEVGDLADLPRALIQARIAGGLSQRELAERLDLKEQQIQRYEATEYASASLARLLEVVRALNVHLRQDVILPSADVSTKALVRRLEDVGLERGFVQKRLLLDDDGDEHSTAWRSALAVGRVFRMPIADVVRGDLTALRSPAAASGMFKLPRGASAPKLVAYSVYARYVAERVLACVPPLKQKPLVKRPRDVFRLLRDEYGGVTFRAALAFASDCGLVVLPLRDSGAFHGAFWRIGGRGILVLKQSTLSSDRWLLDLLHEYKHALQTEGEPDAEMLELEESPFERISSEIERTAVAWATAAALDEREQDLTQQCVDEAHGNVPRLKRVVADVATREGVPRGVLADYLAHRLQTSASEPWWPTATALQPVGEDPWRDAVDALLPKLELHRLDRLDREVLTRALAGNGDAS